MEFPFSELGKAWNYSKIQFSISSMNWEKLAMLARATFKNRNFQSLCELGKTWKYSLSPRIKSSNFESIDELGNVMSYFKFHN